MSLSISSTHWASLPILAVSMVCTFHLLVCLNFADFGLVAVTRAKSLLIIVGDPTVLSLDPLWRSFLNYIFNNGGWKGEPPVWDTNAPVHNDAKYDEEIRELGLADMNELARKLESYTLEDVDDTDDANVDRPWREVE